MSQPTRISERPNLGLLSSLIALMTLIWTVNFLVGKVGLRYLAPLTLASFRVCLAGVLMVPIYLLCRVGRHGQGAPGMSRAEWRTFALLGLLGVAGNQVCFTVGLSYTTVGHSSLIIGIGPILILLLAWAMRLERLTPRKVLGMAVAFVGVFVLASEHGISLRSATLRGDLITLVGSILFALYAVLGKRVADRYDSLTINSLNYFVGAVLVLPLAVRQALELRAEDTWGRVGWQGWAALAYMAVFASVIAYLIYFWALRHMAASRLGAFTYLQPVLTTLLGVLVLGEQLTRSVLLGGALVLLGVYGVEAGPRENQLKEICSEETETQS